MELATSNQEAAKQFYAGLFGWSANDNPMGPDAYYTMFQLNGQNAAAAYTLGKDTPNVPPNWMLYIATADADATAAKAAELGAATFCPPLDVYNYGRMAVLKDPTGVHFSIWQANTHPGITVFAEAGAFCWADCMTDDVPAAQAFYEKLFGWHLDAGNDPSGYLHIKNGDDFIGGMPPSKYRNPNAPPHWLIYFQVDDCAASSEKVKALGGTLLAGPMQIPNAGHFSVVADPQGAVFSIFQPTPRS